MALTMVPTFSSTTFKSRSKSKPRQSQFKLSYATWNEPRETPCGAWADGLITFHPVSLPGSFPGKTNSPVLVLAAAYIRFTVSSCGAVRQLSESPALHRSVAGSNLHVRGSFNRPSLTLSFESHAPMTALFSVSSFAAETALDESFSTGTATP